MNNRNKHNILVVIPARGGSKGIPKKNIRPLNGKPLLTYSIDTLRKSRHNPFIIVSSDDEEILSLSLRFGVHVHKRDKQLAEDQTTLDPVIYSAYRYAVGAFGEEFDIVVTLQPTSPLLKFGSLDNAIDVLISNNHIDTVISGKNDTHLTWRKKDDKFTPNYEKRLNRQYLTPIYRETGGFLITRSNIITQDNRIGQNVWIKELDQSESIDIDTYEDWNLVEYYLKRRKIIFVVEGYNKIGLGHVYNSLSVAHEILDHDVSFLVGSKSQLAFDKIQANHYPVRIQKLTSIVEEIKSLNPDVVILDRLDSDKEFIKVLKEAKIKVITFEDLGEGAKEADLVINAIYPEEEILPNHYFGHRYFVLRDEFLTLPEKSIKKVVNSVLLSFGGVDPSNNTLKVLSAVYDFCLESNIAITVIVGQGYSDFGSLKKFKEVTLHRNVSNISDYMYEADIIFTSAGRTTFEVAATATPAIILAQNSRELTHFFASEQFGFINLGLGEKCSTSEVLEKFKGLVENFSTRKAIHNTMKSFDLKKSKKRVIELIYKVINE